MAHLGIISIAILLGIAAISYRIATRSMLAKAKNGAKPKALPHHYGIYSAMLSSIPAMFFILLILLLSDRPILAILQHDLQQILQDYNYADISLAKQLLASYLTSPQQISNIQPSLIAAAAHYQQLHGIASAAYVAIFACLTITALTYVKYRHTPKFHAREAVEFWLKIIIALASIIAILTTLGIVLSLLFESIRFFQKIPPAEFLFGLKWSPQISIRENQVGASGVFGAVPLFAGTFLITAVAMTVAGPLGLLSAIYMSEYASKKFRNYTKPLLELLAGIPTVVYGFFASLIVAPLLKTWGAQIGLDVAAESALAAGIVMGIMILPFISSLSDDVISAVPMNMREGSYALGATKAETVIKVLIPAALPGIAGAFLLAISRAIGETMIVVMASGLVANLTANPLQAVTTVTTQIATLLVGDQEFDNPKTLAAFALGLALFFITMLLNAVAMWIVRRYKEQYE